jgi:outer membrane protein
MRNGLMAIALSAVSLISSSVSADQPQPDQLSAPLTLKRAVDLALARNPNVAIAQADIERVTALIREARAAALPTLYGNLTYSRLDADRVFSGRTIASANQESANLTLSVPLVAAQRWTNWSHAADNLDLSRANAQEVRRQTAIATARAYLAVIAQRRVQDVNERARNTARSHFEFAKAQFEGGVGNRIDQVRAEQEFQSSETQLRLSKVGLVRAREALGVIVGMQGPADAADDVALPNQAPDVGLALEQAQGRTDILALNVRMQAAQRVVRDSWSDYMPYLTGTFQPFFQNPATLTLPQTGWQAQLILTLPLYDGGLRYGQKDERAAIVADTRARLDASLRQARADVRASFESVLRADEALVSARNAARLSDEALALATLAYKAGATTNIEVIDAERRARDAQTAAVVAEDNARQARVDLLAATGRFP